MSDENKLVALDALVETLPRDLGELVRLIVVGKEPPKTPSFQLINTLLALGVWSAELVVSPRDFGTFYFATPSEHWRFERGSRRELVPINNFYVGTGYYSSMVAAAGGHVAVPIDSRIVLWGSFIVRMAPLV